MGVFLYFFPFPFFLFLFKYKKKFPQMNRLRKALSMNYDNANSEEVGKKRFSLFSNKSKNSLVVEIPTCVEEYASPSAPINIQQHSDIYNRPRSVNIDNSSSNVSFNSSITSNSTHNVKSIHSNDIASPIPTSRSIHKDQFDNESLLQLGMNYHEKGELEKATHYWRLSAETGSPLGLFFYGIALRHGWVSVLISYIITHIVSNPFFLFCF